MKNKYLLLKIYTFLSLNHGRNDECIYTTPPSRAGWERKSIFKRGTACLNSEFSFSEIGYFTKAIEPSLLYVVMYVIIILRSSACLDLWNRILKNKK